MIPYEMTHGVDPEFPIDPVLCEAETQGAELFYVHQIADFFSSVADNRHPECPDGMMLVDSVPRFPIQQINAMYEQARHDPHFDNEAAWGLWKKCFYVPQYARDPLAKADPNGRTLEKYLEDTWTDLAYHPKDEGTRIGTKYPHLRAGAGSRYNVGYYWDTAATLRGLAVDVIKDPGKLPFMRGIVQNVADVIERFGYVPNGFRTYFTGTGKVGEQSDGRSQPPCFVEMVEQLDQVEKQLFGNDTGIIEEFLPQVVKEYNWWIRGERMLQDAVGSCAVEHVVHTRDGELAARHYSPSRDPRPESREEDLRTAARAPDRDPGDVFQNLGAGAEKGTDYQATTQCEDPNRLETIEELNHCSVETNALLASYERFIAEAHTRAGRSVPAAEFRSRFERRVAFINEKMWNAEDGTFHDWNWVKEEQVPHSSISTAVPIRLGLTTKDRTRQGARTLKDEYLQRGGFVTTLLELEDPQQWDRGKRINRRRGRGNGWPRQQMDGVAALEIAASLTGQRQYKIAAHIARMRWIQYNRAIYQEFGTIPEKVDVESDVPIPGYSGEYPTQGDFGWGRAAMILFAHDLSNRRGHKAAA